MDDVLKVARCRALTNDLTFDEARYEYDFSFKPANLSDAFQVHTTAELVAFLERNPDAELDAKVIGIENGKRTFKTVESAKFLDAFKSDKFVKMREAGADPFDTDSDSYNNLVGQDFIPLLGGPFYKNLYYYQDYIRMHSLAFQQFHHNPIARAIVNITRDFTLGRGYRVDSENQAAMALWRAFEKVNKLPEMMNYFALEFSTYGETMIWKLPNNETKIGYQLRAGESIPTGIIPRVRLIDVSNIIEIVTYPEDITRALFAVWLAPTQYQIYTGAMQGQETVQPSLKFIYRQIPAEQFLHYKTGCMSNEKRGRSDLFPIFGYLKRLQDCINYTMIAHQKQAAWALDTTIEGDQTDIDAYVMAQQSLGTIASAGSEFVHTDKIKREFLSNQVNSGGKQESFEWVLDMIAAGSQIPISYLGTHISGGQTKASALVATEPVAKKFEMRQLVYERVIRDLWDYCMEWAGLGQVDLEVTFPEIITQDRDAKLKSLALAETQGWIKKERAAEIAAKELGITDFEYEDEKQETEQASAPLTSPAKAQAEPQDATPKPQAVTKTEKARTANNDRKLTYS
jgi:hypothetical protein